MDEETMANLSASQGGQGDEEIIDHERLFRCETCHREFGSFQGLGDHQVVHRRTPLGRHYGLRYWAAQRRSRLGSFHGLGGHRAVHKRSLSFDERMLASQDRQGQEEEEVRLSVSEPQIETKVHEAAIQGVLTEPGASYECPSKCGHEIEITIPETTDPGASHELPYSPEYIQALVRNLPSDGGVLENEDESVSTIFGGGIFNAISRAGYLMYSRFMTASLLLNLRMLGDYLFNPITCQSQRSPSARLGIAEPTQGLGRRLRKKVEALIKKPEGISNELLIGLLAATCQNLAQITTLSTSSSDTMIRRNVVIAANGGGFLLLLCGMLRRSTGRGGHFGNLLILFGILLSAAGILMNMSVNISGVSGFVIPAVCLLLVLAALLC